MNTELLYAKKPELFSELMKQATKTFGSAWITTNDLVHLPIRQCEGAKLIDVLFHLGSAAAHFHHQECLDRWLDWHRGIEVDGFVLARSSKERGAWRVLRAKPARSLVDIELDDLLGDIPEPHRAKPH
jgi:hypothetical protein